MTDNLVVPPPTPRIVDYPAATGMAFGVLFITLLLFISGRFDPTHGTLTVSLLVVVAFVGTVIFCLFFTVPQDQTTAAIVGGLVAAFGAVISYWLRPPPKDKD